MLNAARLTSSFILVREGGKKNCRRMVSIYSGWNEDVEKSARKCVCEYFEYRRIAFNL